MTDLKKQVKTKINNIFNELSSIVFCDLFITILAKIKANLVTDPKDFRGFHFNLFLNHLEDLSHFTFDIKKNIFLDTVRGFKPLHGPNHLRNYHCETLSSFLNLT